MKILNPISFDPSNRSLKFQESIGTPIPKAAVHLGVCRFIPSHSFTFLGVRMWFSGCILNLHLSMTLPWSWTQG